MTQRREATRKVTVSKLGKNPCGQALLGHLPRSQCE